MTSISIDFRMKAKRWGAFADLNTTIGKIPRIACFPHCNPSIPSPPERPPALKELFMARICLINPRFPTSFWGLNHGLPLLGKKSNMPVLALPVLAGLTPPEHEVVLIDENIEEIDFDALEAVRHRRPDRHDGPARPDARDPGGAARSGASSPSSAGPGSRVAEDWFDGPGRRDLRRRGRGDLAAVPRGVGARRLHQYRYEQAEKTDMTKVPHAALRPGPVPRVRDGLRPDLARLPVPVRVLRHHRHLRPQAADQDGRAGRRRDRRPAPARVRA